MNTIKLLHSIAFVASALIFAATSSTTQAENLSVAPVSQAEILATQSRPDIQQIESSITKLTRSTDGPGLIETLKQVEARSDLGTLAQALLRYRILMNLAQTPETGAARALLERHLGDSVQIHVWHEDGPYRLAVAAFDAAAAARFTLGAWNMNAWQRHAAEGLASGDSAFLSDWLKANRQSGGQLSDAGLVLAFEQAAQSSLAGWPLRLEELLASGRPVAGVSAVVASRLHDSGLASAIVRDADTLQALQFIQRFKLEQPAYRVTPVLSLALLREDTASAAIYHLAALDSHDSRALVFGQLSSPANGGSAAAALARAGGSETIEALAKIARSVDVGEANDTAATQRLAQRRAVLALHLIPDSAGLGALQSLHSDPGIDSELRDLVGRKLTLHERNENELSQLRNMP